MTNSTKQSLYDVYVSSGQSGGSIGKDVADHFRSNAPYIEKMIRTHLPAERRSRIVDLGCGHGVFFGFGLSAGSEAIGGGGGVSVAAGVRAGQRN